MSNKRDLEQWTDRFLVFSDSFYQHAVCFFRKSVLLAKKIHIGIQGDTLVFRLTAIGVILVVLSILASCQTLPPQSLPIAERWAPVPPSLPEEVYTREDTLSIRSRETGSITGSMWADSHAPRALLADHRPSRIGDVVTVSIPETLEPKGQAPQQEAGEGAMPPRLGNIKMEIVSMDNAGNVLLQTRKSFSNSHGMRKDILVSARLPRRTLKGFEGDAAEVTAVQLLVDDLGFVTEYEGPGWDEKVSAALLGLYPDNTPRPRNKQAINNPDTPPPQNEANEGAAGQ